METHDWKGASELYLSLQMYSLAADVIVPDKKHVNWAAALMEVVKATPISERGVLETCGEKFTAHNEDLYAKETYLRLGDVSKLMSLYCR